MGLYDCQNADGVAADSASDSSVNSGGNLASIASLVRSSKPLLISVAGRRREKVETTGTLVFLPCERRRRNMAKIKKGNEVERRTNVKARETERMEELREETRVLLFPLDN